MEFVDFILLLLTPMLNTIINLAIELRSKGEVTYKSEIFHHSIPSLKMNLILGYAISWSASQKLCIS